jgi:histone H1/5
MAKVKKKTAKPKAKTAAKPKAKMAAKPKAKMAAKPKAKTAAKPKAKMAAKPKAKMAAKPKAKMAAKPKAKLTAIKSPAAPGRTAAEPRRTTRDEHAGVTIAAIAPERVARAPRPEPAPLRMPYAVPVERPIAPLELRPRPLFAREVSPHDDEE